MPDSGPPRIYRWPVPVRSQPSRLIGVYRSDGTILDEAGELHDATSWANVRQWCSDHHGLLLVRDIDRLPFVPDVLADPSADMAYAERTDSLASIRIRDRDGRTSWVVECEGAWGITATPDALRAIRTVWTAGGVGDYITAGAWGSAIAGACWPQGERRVINLASGLADLIRRTMVGGRCDTPDVGRMLVTAMEYDINSAYASEVRVLPAGSPCWQVGEPINPVTGYYWCEWTARPDSGSQVAISPLHATDEAATDRGARQRSRYYPSSGMHWGWYWWAEIAAARAVGIDVQIAYGWEWQATTTALSPWVDRMAALRVAVGPEYAGLVKLATVATIGRWAAQPITASVHIAQPDEPTVREATRLRPALAVTRTYTDRPGLIPHLTSYVMAASRLRVWHAALAASAQGVYVSHDYDSVLATGPIAGVDLGPDPGQWKVTPLTGVTVAAPRSIVSQERVRLPGQTGPARNKALAAMLAFDPAARRVACYLCGDRGYAGYSEYDRAGTGYHVCERCTERLAEGVTTWQSYDGDRRQVARRAQLSP